VENGVAAVRVLAHLDTGMHEVRPQRTGRDLQMKTVERHGIVVGDLALFLDAQDFVEIDTGNRHKRRSLLLSLHREPRVMRRYISRANIAVGEVHGRDPCQRQFLHQAVLQRVEQTLRAATRLGRIRRDVFDTQMRQRSPHLRRMRAIDAAAGLGSVE
jgi:hypothetical protein